MLRLSTHVLLPSLLLCSVACTTVTAADIDAALDRDGDGVFRDEGDCDDDDPAVGASSLWFPDEDGDGFGDAEAAVDACTAPEGHVADDTDCDDADALVSPDGAEICNAADDDCNGDIDDGASDFLHFFPDADGDGFGDTAAAGVVACEAPLDHVLGAGDCDDSEPDVNPDGNEICDGLDNDCDGDTDPGVGDADGDGIPNCSDPEPYHQDFDGYPNLDATGWDGVCGSGQDGRWQVNALAMYYLGNYMSVGADPAIATGPDLEDMAVFSIEVRQSVVHNSGYFEWGHDSVVWAFVDCDNYWMVRANDPARFYDPGTGGWATELRIVRRQLGSSNTLAVVPIEQTLGAAELTKITVRVDGEDIWASWESLLNPTKYAEVEYTNTLFPSPHAGVIGVAHGATHQTIQHLYDDVLVTVP